MSTIPPEAAIVEALRLAKTVPLFRTPLTVRTLPAAARTIDVATAHAYLQLGRNMKLDKLFDDCGVPHTTDGLAALLLAVLSQYMAGFRIDPDTRTKRGAPTLSAEEVRRRAAICDEIRQQEAKSGSLPKALLAASKKYKVNERSLRKWLSPNGRKVTKKPEQPDYASALTVFLAPTEKI